MKLKEFAANINEILKNNPEYGELDVIYSRDDEGNGFNSVYFTPTLGNYDGERGGDFMDHNPNAEDPEDTCSVEEINAICIN